MAQGVHAFKPFSINDEPQSADDPWAERSSRWLAFLEQHPEAFDSLDTLDDLATALLLHPDVDSESHEEDLDAILERANEIAVATLRQSPSTCLYWLISDNRPALRAVFRRHSLALRRYDEQAATEYANMLLARNPNDNHGLRCWLVNQHLTRSEDAQALAIAERYPDDIFAETRYGKVLALHRLGRTDEARAALADACRALPKVARYLAAERVEQPEILDFGMRPGGDDQAWLYREVMCEVWVETKGAMKMLEPFLRSG